MKYEINFLEKQLELIILTAIYAQVNCYLILQKSLASSNIPASGLLGCYSE